MTSQDYVIILLPIWFCRFLYTSVFCMFGMALTRPRHWQMAWTSSRMCAGKRQTSINNIQPHTRDVSAFVKCVTIFRLFFFWKASILETNEADMPPQAGRAYNIRETIMAQKIMWSWRTMSIRERHIGHPLSIDTMVVQKHECPHETSAMPACRAIRQTWQQLIDCCDVLSSSAAVADWLQSSVTYLHHLSVSRMSS